MNRLSAPQSRKLDDPTLEAVRREHEQKIVELQRIAVTSTGTIISDVSLADATAVTISHRLGRKPKMIAISPPRGATATGRIVESRPNTVDRTQAIVLTATGHGATITVDIEVK